MKATVIQLVLGAALFTGALVINSYVQHNLATQEMREFCAGILEKKTEFDRLACVVDLQRKQIVVMP